MSLLARFRRAVNKSIEVFGAQRFRAGGENVVCPVCGNREFVRSSGGTYVKPILLRVNVPWLMLSERATTLICTHCTHILRFGRPPDLVELEAEND